MLDNMKLGFIGGGMMAEAIIRGLIASGVDTSRINVSDPVDARLKYLNNELGIIIADNNADVVKFADIIILAVKPFVISDVITDITGLLRENHLLISIAAGVTIPSIQAKIQIKLPVIRVMPNTPALIRKGASAVAPGSYATELHVQLAMQIFESIGKAIITTEDKMDAVTGLSGSGPAYVYTLIEALADGGVKNGLPKSTALLLAAQTVAGAAEMVMQTDTHPAILKDRVMTPGGTTIAGIASLERDGFRSALIEAVTAATERSKELGKG